MESKPKTYMAWSIVGLLICRIPAVIGIFMGLQVHSFWDDGNVEMARRYSRNALICNIVCYLVGALAIIATLILIGC